MQRVINNPVTTSYEKEELKSFSRSMAELQWLLLILVILYFFIPIRPIDNHDGLRLTMVCYSGFVLLFRYLNFQARESRLKLAVETWAMVSFITIVLWYTGKVDSPLLNLMMANTSTEHTRTAAERILTAVNNTSFDMQGVRIASTVSVGIASFPECVEDAAEVLDKADIALYQSKQGGRNKVTYYDKAMEKIAVYA